MNCFYTKRFSAKIILFISTFACFSLVKSQTTYTWVGGKSGDYTVAANWSPARASAASNDVLVFNTDATVTGITSQTIGQLLLSNNASVNLQASAGGSRTLTVGSSNLSGDEISVPAGCTLTLATNTTGVKTEFLTIGLANTIGVTANIAGTLTLEPNALVSATGAVEYSLNTAYSLNQLVTNKGQLYQVTTAGTSAASGNGPGVIANTANDGSVVFTYLGTLYGNNYAAAYNNAYNVQNGVTTITGTINYAGRFSNTSLLTAATNSLQIIGATFNNLRNDAVFPGAGTATTTNAPLYSSVNVNISGVQFISVALYLYQFPASLNALNFNCPNMTSGSIRPSSYADGNTTLNATNIAVNIGVGGQVMLPNISKPTRVNVAENLTVNSGTLNFGWSNPETVSVAGTLAMPSVGNINANTQYADSLIVNNLSLTGTGTYGTINSGVEHVINVLGNFTKTTGNISTNALSKLRFAGTGAQTIDINGINNAGKNLTIEIASAANSNTITLAKSLICANLVLNSGVLATTSSNFLTVTGSVTGGSANSYISGYIRYIKTGLSAFTLPFGMNGLYYPLTVTPTSATTDTFIVAYLTPTPNLIKITAPLANVFNNGYYTVRLNSGTSAASFSAAYTFAPGVVKSTKDLVFAKYGTAWTLLSATPIVTGNVTSGNISDNTPVDLSNTATLLVIGSNNSATILPVKLKYINGYEKGLHNQIVWESATEENLASYQIEKLSKNGKVWNVMGEFVPKGAAHKYEFLDIYVTENTSSYRLKIVDASGSYTYSKVISINHNLNKKAVAYPNPFSNTVNIDLGTTPDNPINYYVVTLQGKCVHSGILTAKVTSCSLADLPCGNYICQLSNGTALYVAKN